MGISALTYTLWIFMILMGVSFAYIIFYARNAINALQRLVVYLLVGMMNGMFVGVLVYLIFPGAITIYAGAEITVFAMFIEIIPFLLIFFRDVSTSNAPRPTSFMRYYILVFAILSELLMSMDFRVILNPGAIHLLTSQTVGFIASSVSSYWFIFPMSLEMVLTAVFSRQSLRKTIFVVFVFQSAIMLLSPPAINATLWTEFAIYLAGAVMTAFFIYIFETLYRKQSLMRAESNYVILLMCAYLLMMAGIFIWQIDRSLYLFSLSLVFEMVIYLRSITEKDHFDKGSKTYWLADKRWSFSFLLTVFIAEFFMGGTFDMQFFGSSFISSLNLATLSGSFQTVISAFLYDFVAFVGGITGSVWFLVMMGIEMGSLVVFKIKVTRDLETRVRLGLLIVAYATYSVLIPSFIIPNTVSNYPFLGWSMGIGSGGPVSPLLILPMVLTYVISGILSFLFGSRQLCSVFCTAPLMYQGTFYDSMKKFNRSSNGAKSVTSFNKTGNRIYRVVSLTVYASIIGTAVISYLDSIGKINLYIFGADPEYFLYIFYFDILWYVVFITMPYVGSYGCVNTGYCHWGNFNRFISKFGFFRLKVKDTNQCVTCKTKDCAQACPVGNYGQPGSFISKGEYRDGRCIGIGDCVNACPYDNIFYYDVRHWIKEKMSVRDK